MADPSEYLSLWSLAQNKQCDWFEIFVFAKMGVFVFVCGEFIVHLNVLIYWMQLRKALSEKCIGLLCSCSRFWHKGRTLAGSQNLNFIIFHPFFFCAIWSSLYILVLFHKNSYSTLERIIETYFTSFPGKTACKFSRLQTCSSVGLYLIPLLRKYFSCNITCEYHFLTGFL